MNLSTESKIAIVTGGTRGIGREIVKELSSDNSFTGKCKVAFTYRSCDECAEKLVAEIKANGGHAVGYKTDASSFEEANSTIQEIIKSFGRVDFLINNAGVTKDNLLLRMSESDFENVINVNLKSVFNYTKAVSRQFIKQRFGKIVNISSIVGIIGNAGQANYAASKAGVIGFTKSVAKELASRNININAVAPGFIETEMTEKLNEEQRKNLLSNVPLNRMGRTEDIAKVVSFLCSSAANYITGQVITVDGGMVM